MERIAKLEIDENTIVQVTRSEDGELRIDVSRRDGHPVHFYLEGQKVGSGDEG